MCGFYNMWMAIADKNIGGWRLLWYVDGQSFWKNGWSMLLKYAEINVFNTIVAGASELAGLFCFHARLGVSHARFMRGKVWLAIWRSHFPGRKSKKIINSEIRMNMGRGKSTRLDLPSSCSSLFWSCAVHAQFMRGTHTRNRSLAWPPHQKQSWNNLSK